MTTQTSSPLKRSRRTGVIFDNIFDDKKILRDIVIHLQMEQNDAAAQTAIKQSQINELIAECDELSHILI
ncbi:hypothetical protein PABG_11180 [Paracoccidioides brasiliensis Pb03]|nr:hypothetical protein PABG_11180 [Paracoccidioides brasiliensis Pb03]